MYVMVLGNSVYRYTHFPIILMFHCIRCTGIKKTKEPSALPILMVVLWILNYLCTSLIVKLDADQTQV